MNSFNDISKMVLNQIENIDCNDEHIDNIFEILVSNLKKLGYEVKYGKYCCDGDWIDDGKYSYLENFVQHLVVNGIDLIFKNIQCSRSGSYYSDYYYCNQGISEPISIEKFLEPKVVYTFEFKKHNIECLSNNKARVGGKNEVFDSVELAILSLI